jgi:rhodanese-related sulfurtransferase
MSADAVDDLAAMGYTDIVELEGGFDAWVASGRTLAAAAADGG